MRHTELRQHEAQPGAGYFFCAPTGGFPLTPAIVSRPLTLPSLQRREREGAA